MKKVFEIIFFAVFIAVVISCGESKTNVKVFTLNKSDFNDWAGLLNITDSVTLQETDSCIITYADKCILSGDSIYFWDHKVKCVYCFSKEGNIIRKIGNRGRSSSEYIEIKDMLVDKTHSILNIMDDRGILCYDLHTGNFIKRHKLSSPNSVEYERFAIVGEDSFLCFTDNRNKYSIVLDAPEKQIGLRESKRYHFVRKNFFSYDNRLMVLSDYGEFYIDEYIDGKLVPVYEIDLGNKALPDDFCPKTFEEFNIVDSNPEYFKCITEAYETSKWLYLVMVGPNQTYYYAFINKDTGKYVFGRDMNVVVVGADKESFHALIYPEYLPKESYVWKLIEHQDRQDKRNPIFIKFKINENRV